MAEGFSNYCIVELFGHQKIAGLVTEQTLAGQGFIRVDVSATKRFPAFTRMFGSGAIYSITPVDEETAKAAAESIYIEPVTVYIAPGRDDRPMIERGNSAELEIKSPAELIERFEDMDDDEDNGFDDDERDE